MFIRRHDPLRRVFLERCAQVDAGKAPWPSAQIADGAAPDIGQHQRLVDKERTTVVLFLIGCAALLNIKSQVSERLQFCTSSGQQVGCRSVFFCVQSFVGLNVSTTRSAVSSLKLFDLRILPTS